VFSEKLLHLTYKNLLAVSCGYFVMLYFEQIHALINTVCSFIVWSMTESVLRTHSLTRKRTLVVLLVNWR